jgi:hypothetical protein
MDIRYVALSEWVGHDLMILEPIHVSVSMADHLTKILERTLFYWHMNYILGHIPPAYSACHEQFLKQSNMNIQLDINIEDLVMTDCAAAASRVEKLTPIDGSHIGIQHTVPIQCWGQLDCGGGGVRYHS